jgi:hypothetical protein
MERTAMQGSRTDRTINLVFKRFGDFRFSERDFPLSEPGALAEVSQ